MFSACARFLSCANGMAQRSKLLRRAIRHSTQRDCDPLRTALKEDDDGWKLRPGSGACPNFTCMPPACPQNKSPLPSFLAAARCCPSVRDAIETLWVKPCLASLERWWGQGYVPNLGDVQCIQPRSPERALSANAHLRVVFPHGEASTLGTFPAITTWQRSATNSEP